MKQFRVLATALAAALLVAACGGGGNGDQTPPVKYSAVVSFGDSLSDAGTYNVGAIKAAGGGMFTVNGIAGAIGADTVPSENWAQLVSASAVGKPSCAARLGGFGVAETAVAGCTNYAQGGSRVTDPNGIGNASGGAVAAGTMTAGALTEPVVTQIANYIKDSGGFTGNELITVLAGPNDLFAQLTKLTADANAAAGTAFVGSVSNALISGTGAAPAGAATAIQTAMGTAMAKAAAASGATTITIFTAGGNAGVSAAAAAGNTAVMNMTGITAYAGTAQGLANTAFGNTLAGGLVANLAAANQATAVPAISAAITTAGAAANASSASIVQAAAQAAGIDAATHSYVNANLANAAAIGTAAGNAASTAFVTSMVGSLTTGTGAAPSAAATAIQTAMGSAITAAAGVSGATNTSIFTAATNAGVMTAAGAGNTAVMNMTLINSVMGAAQTAAITNGNTYAAGAGALAARNAVVTAAATLAGYVKDMVNKGAKHVVVLNLPDMSLTPSARGTIIYNADGSIKDNSSQQLVLALVNAFNAELQKDLGVTLGVPANGVLLVDFFTNMQNNVNDPGHYALTNTKDVACNLTAPANALATVGLDDGSSLVCNASNLIAGDTSHYMFADKVHPTPYSYKLLSQVVNKIMIQAGWL